MTQNNSDTFYAVILLVLAMQFVVLHLKLNASVTRKILNLVSGDVSIYFIIKKILQAIVFAAPLLHEEETSEDMPVKINA